MNKKYASFFASALLTGLLSLAGGEARAQAVIFPQQEQPGIAQSATDGTTYTLKNDLLTATFVKKDGHLTFGGCEAMNLNPGQELFKLVLGDGTTVLSSEMTLGEVKLVDLTPDNTKAKAALKLPGKAIEATFTKDKLTVKWQAILRDGSHYLRTELDLSASADQAMTAVYPMIYDVNSQAAGSAPVVVGNTRGAILASDKIFAGLETPMGINSVKGTTDLASFTPKSWNSGSFVWTPGDDTPEGITKLGYTKDQIVGARGYVTFLTGGTVKLTFAYSSGNNRLNIAGVDVTDGQGKVLASDYHKGYTGNNKENNVYTLTLPEGRKSCIIRYFVDTTEAITSSGSISYDQKIKVPVVVYDLKADDATAAN